MSGIAWKRQEMQLIFTLGMLKPNGLDINFSFISVFSSHVHAPWFVSCARALRAHFSVMLLYGATCIFLHTDEGLYLKRLCFYKLWHLYIITCVLTFLYCNWCHASIELCLFQIIDTGQTPLHKFAYHVRIIVLVLLSLRSLSINFLSLILFLFVGHKAGSALSLFRM